MMATKLTKHKVDLNEAHNTCRQFFLELTTAEDSDIKPARKDPPPQELLGAEEGTVNTRIATANPPQATTERVGLQDLKPPVANQILNPLLEPITT